MVRKISLISSVKRSYLGHKAFYRYLLISIFVTVLDTIVARLSEQFTKIIIANSLGIIAGFIVQYFLVSRHVYNSQNMKTFIKFILTFILGFIMANAIIYICRILIFNNSTSLMAFMVSKGFSILIPFFIIYYIRNKWIGINESEMH